MTGWLSQNCRDGKHPTPDGPPPCAGCDCPCHPAPTPLARLSDVPPELAALVVARQLHHGPGHA